MDLKVYYQKLRQIESGISEPDVVIVSQPTPEGGIARVETEVPRAIAAKMVLERSARLATKEETARFREKVAETKRLADEAAIANRLQVTVVSEAEHRKAHGQSRPTKS
jgi:hypothetical protein